jgi:hypothetical protein
VDKGVTSGICQAQGGDEHFLVLVLPYFTQPFVLECDALCGGVWLDLSLLTSSWVDPGSDLNGFPTKPSKTINPPGKPEGNAAHRVHNAVSPEISLWMTVITKCLQSRNECGSRSVFYISLCIKHVINSSISNIHSSLALHMQANTSS